MAGIGFELRKLLRRESLLDYVKAYGFAGLISSGPWVFSIASVITIGCLSAQVVKPKTLVIQFLISITYQMACSLILTGPLQLLFSRFIADRIYVKRHNEILPNLLGALTLTTLVSGCLGTVLVAALLPATLFYKALMVATFVTLCNSWVVVVLLSSLKAYTRVLAAFFGGNLISLVAALALRSWALSGLLLGFEIGQAALTFVLLALVVRDNPSPKLLSFDFLRPSQSFYSLALCGFLYNVGIWSDKIIFWMTPETSEPVLGPMRSSLLYDLPIFVAYLSIIPGMAVFLMRIETDFAEQYEGFFRAVRGGATLSDITDLKDGMVRAVRLGLYDIFKVQGLTIALMILTGPILLNAFGISPLYLPMLRIDIVGVAVQVLLLAILNVLFYLDKRSVALAVTATFAVSNIVLTRVSVWLGPEFFGYGFTLAAVLAMMVGLFALSSKLEKLEFEVFMSQR